MLFPCYIYVHNKPQKCREHNRISSHTPGTPSSFLLLSELVSLSPLLPPVPKDDTRAGQCQSTPTSSDHRLLNHLLLSLQLVNLLLAALPHKSVLASVHPRPLHLDLMLVSRPVAHLFQLSSSAIGTFLFYITSSIFSSMHIGTFHLFLPECRRRWSGAQKNRGARKLPITPQSTRSSSQ